MKPAIDWDAQPLGEEPDRAIARRLGVACMTVGNQRKRRGIPPHSQPKPKGIDWDAVANLGEVADCVIARRLGVTRGSVGVARKRRGILLTDAARAQAAGARRGGARRGLEARGRYAGDYFLDETDEMP